MRTVMLALVVMLAGHAEAQMTPLPRSPMPQCYPGQTLKYDLGGWGCVASLERVNLPIWADVFGVDLGVMPPRTCAVVRTSDGHAARLHDIYALTATLTEGNGRGLLDRGGTLLLASARAELGEVVVELCNIHESEDADGDRLRVQWVAIHADPN